jgi:hypothetical protein
MLILEGLYLGDVRSSERSFRRSSLYALILCIQLRTMVYCRYMNFKAKPLPGASDYTGGIQNETQ